MKNARANVKAVGDGVRSLQPRRSCCERSEKAAILMRRGAPKGMTLISALRFKPPASSAKSRGDAAVREMVCDPASLSSWSVRIKMPLEFKKAPQGATVQAVKGESSTTVPDFVNAPAVALTPNADARAKASTTGTDAEARSASHKSTGGSSGNLEWIFREYPSRVYLP